MASLPQNFSPTEHLQDAIKRVYNKQVREFFSDLGGEDWDPSIATPRASARLSCTHQERDTIHETVARMLLFKQFVDGGVGVDIPIYGLPTQAYQEVVRFKPQIFLYFQERVQDVKPGYAPVTGQISVRLKEETERLTETDLRTLANKIKGVFGGSTGQRWNKGKKMFTYVDSAKGHNFQILCQTSSTGKTLITKTMNLIGETPDWSKANFKGSEDESKAFPSNPKNKTILGKSRKGIRRRPVAVVYFKAAVLHVHGLPNPITLYDRSGAYPKAIVSEFGN